MARAKYFRKMWAPVAAVAALLSLGSTGYGQNRAAWMQQAKWGVMTHFLADWRARVDNETMSVDKWNELVDHFDVEGLADQIKSVGAGYHILTIGQNSGYYDAPNPTYDKLVGIEPSKCSRRDLISDMADALAKRGIKLIVYLPSGAPAGDHVASEALEWRNGAYRNREFELKWEQVVRDWSLRFGTKVAGWWFDGCYWPNTMYRSPEPPNFESLAAAARAGNPASAIAFNRGVEPRLISMSPYEDYTAGEESTPSRVEIRRAEGGMLDGAQIQVLSYLGRTWGMGEPRFPVDEAIKYSLEVRKVGGAITWDIPVQKNGLISQPFIDQLTAIGKALNSPAPANP
jgi:Alpha-L-fucosidase